MCSFLGEKTLQILRCVPEESRSLIIRLIFIHITKFVHKIKYYWKWLLGTVWSHWCYVIKQTNLLTPYQHTEKIQRCQHGRTWWVISVYQTSTMCRGIAEQSNQYGHIFSSFPTSLSTLSQNNSLTICPDDAHSNDFQWNHYSAKLHFSYSCAVRAQGLCGFRWCIKQCQRVIEPKAQWMSMY